MITINGGQVSVITSPFCYRQNTDAESSSVAASDANAAMTPRGGYKCDLRALNTKSSTRTITETDCAGAMFVNGNCENVRFNSYGSPGMIADE